MVSNHVGVASTPDPHLVPPILATWLSVVRPCFTAPVWGRVLVLVAGAVLASGKRTVTQVSRVMGLADEAGFRRYHEVLSRAGWDARAVARRLLLYIVERLLPDGEVVIGIDDTIERRWGARIKARGIYRDPVRSSKGHFVKACPCEGGDQWPALAVADGLRADPVGGTDLGAAIPDRPGTLGAMERGQWKAAQDADDVGPPSDPANQALVAQPPSDLPRRQRLFRARPACRCPPPCLHGHAAAAGRQLVSARTKAAAGTAGPHAGEGTSLAKARRRADEQEDGLDQRGGLSMVQRPAAHAAGRHRHRALVPRRHRAGADPLAAGPRPLRRARTVRISQHRPWLPSRPQFSVGSSRAGVWKPRSRRSAPISAWRRSANGRIWRFCALPRRCSGYSR